MGRKGDFGRGQKQKKGGTGGSNPEGNRFRSKARAQSVAAAKAASKAHGSTLNPGNLAAHNDANTVGAIDLGLAPGDVRGTDEDVFAGVFSKMNSMQEFDQQNLAVLQGAKEALQQSGRGTSAGAYWSALMTMLEKAGGTDEKMTTSVIYLLALITPRVPAAMMQRQFGGASTLLMQVLKHYAQGTSQALLKSCMSCISATLAKQDLSPAMWTTKGQAALFRPLLVFATDTRPKVRREAQTGVASLIRTAKASAPAHPIMEAAAKYCLGKLDKPQTTEQMLMHTLNLLKEVLPLFPVTLGQQTCQRIFVHAAGDKPVVYEGCMGVILSLFQNADISTMPSPLLRQLLTALHGRKPDMAHTGPRLKWNLVMAAGYALLAKVDAAAAFAAFPRVCSGLIECFASTNQQVVENTAKCLKQVTDSCLGEAAVAFQQAAAAPSGTATPAHAVVAAFESSLNYRYRSAYPKIMGSITDLYRALGTAAHPLANSITVTLVQLRGTESVECKEHIEVAVGAAIRAMGPDTFLQLCPLGLESEVPLKSFPSGWLFPVLKSASTNSKLEIFGRFFLPLAGHLAKVEAVARAQNQELIAAQYHNLWTQTWEMLHSFCTNPSDVDTYFTTVAPVFGKAIQDNAEIRGAVCTAVVQLVRTCANKAAFAPVAKNFMIVFLNVYVDVTTSDGDRDRCLKAIEAFVEISDAALSKSFLQTVFTRLAEHGKKVEALAAKDDADLTAAAKKSQHSMMELGLAIADGMNDVDALYMLTKPFINSPDTTLQKKAFKALSLISQTDGAPLAAFLQKSGAEMLDLLVRSTDAGSGTKYHRLVTIKNIMAKLPGNVLAKFVPAVVIEVVMGTKEVQERTRKAAYDCLVQVGHAIVKVEAAAGPSSPIKFQQYFERVSALLGGKTPHMMSAATLAMSRLLFQFSEQLTPDQTGQVLATVCMLLKLQSQEIVKSAVGFVKVALDVMTKDTLEPHLGALVEGIVEKAGITFRQKARKRLEKLIKMFGYDRVHDLMPEEHRRLIVNIRRTKERKQRGAGAGGGAGSGVRGASAAAGEERGPSFKPGYEELMNESDDSEDDDADADAGGDLDAMEVSGGGGRRGAGGGARVRGGHADEGRAGMYIKDDDEHQTLDFLDASAVTRFRSKLPAARKERTGSQFPKGSDGRMFVVDPEDPDAVKEARSMGVTGIRSVDDDGDDAGDGGFNRAAERKRARRPWGQEDDNDWEDEAADEEEPAAGGGGKRSRTAKAPAVRTMGHEYKAKKAAGDVKLAGKAAPFAYMTFDKNQLNKRKKAKAVGKFKNLLAGATKGVRAARKMASIKQSGRKANGKNRR